MGFASRDLLARRTAASRCGAAPKGSPPGARIFRQPIDFIGQPAGPAMSVVACRERKARGFGRLCWRPHCPRAKVARTLGNRQAALLTFGQDDLADAQVASDSPAI